MGHAVMHTLVKEMIGEADFSASNMELVRINSVP